MSELTVTSAEQTRLDKVRRARWRGRTDLFWLAREVLGYKQVEADVHGPLISRLQRFPAPPADELAKLDSVTAIDCRYRGPWTPMQNLPGGRRRLILDSRGFYKTSLNVICHCIQWILNYPDIAILIVHAKAEVAEDILNEIRGHFLHNRIFRELYPDYCPNPKDAGNALRLTVPNRTRNRKEPTIGVSSINTVVAGYHYDVIKFSDIVTELNTGTKEQIQKVVAGFGMYRNVLVAPDSWIDVEGTCYHADDLYSQIIDQEAKRKVEERRWSIYVRGAYKKDTGGRPYTFLPEERELQDLVVNGSKVSWFPAKFPVHELESMRKDPTQSEFLFNAQQLNNPIADDSAAFPRTLFRTKSTEDMRKVPMAYYTTTVDTAETVAAGSDYSVILTCGWDANGRCYVVDAKHGKMMPDELIRNMFVVNEKWHPRSIRIEETGYVRGLKTSIAREEYLKGVYLPFLFLPRDNQQAKTERILQTLQPWYQRGEIWFADDLPCRDHFLKELTSFPKGRTDDLIDALSDQFQAREWVGREVGKPETKEQYDTYLKKAMADAFDNRVNGMGRDNVMGPFASDRDSRFFDSTGGL